MPNRLKVLVVDDHPATAESLAEYLTESGCNAKSATSGEEALSLCIEFAPACVLLDLRMPKMNGVELAQRLRRIYGGTVTLIGLTGADAEASEFQLMLALCEHVLQKPVDLQQLKKLLHC